MNDPLTLNGIRFDHAVYPGQPAVCAAALTMLFDNLDAAAARTEHGWCAAESSKSPGAGSQNTSAVEAMLKYRKHRDIDALIEELHDLWGRTVLHQKPYAPRHAEGLEKAHQLDDYLRATLPTWINGETP